MKKLFLLLTTIVSLEGFAQVVTIPDANFKAALLAHSPIVDTNDDGEIQVSEAEAFTGSLNLYSKGITDMTGIETFINLTSLNVGWNTTLPSLDVTQNTELTSLYADKCDLSSIDVSNNTKLYSLYLSQNSLTSIDLSNLSNLHNLFIYTNDLTTLDLSNNENISSVYCRGNNISTFTPPLDKSGILALSIGDNPFATNFDFSPYTALSYIEVSTSGLTSLDVSMLPNLTTLYANSNSLTSLNANNGRQLNNLSLQSNPSLTCISVYDTDEPASMSLNVDAGVNFEEDCDDPTLYIPDPNFRAALLSHSPVIDLDGDGKIRTSEANAFGGTINVSGKDILSVTGIEAFTSATGVLLNDNQIKALDLSANTSLTSINVADNRLTILKVDNGINTSVTYFNATGNPDLSCITVDDPTYSTSNWLGIPAGTGYSTDCAVDIPNAAFKTALTSHTPDIDLNDDGEIQISEALAFTDDLNVGNNAAITDITGIEAFQHITYLLAGNNDLQTIDLSQNTRLQDVRLFNNYDLAEIEISTLNDLVIGYFSNLSLTEIDVTNSPKLNKLYIGLNDITEIDLSGNPSLEILSAGDNQIKTIDFSNNQELDEVYLHENELTTLDLSVISGYSNINITNNLNLLCVKVHSISYANSRVGINLSTYLSEETCPPAIPDPKLRTALLNHIPVIDTNDDDILQYDEIVAFNDTLHLPYKLITDLTGLEYFVNLVGLEVNNNSINEIDVSALTSLKHLNISSLFSGGISSMDLSNNTQLESLIMTGCGLNTLDVSDLTNLKHLECNYMGLTTVDLSSNTNLEYLEIENNDLTTLDLSNNVNLKTLLARVNPFSTVDLGSNIMLEELDLQASGITSLDLSSNTNIKRLITSNSHLTSLDVSTIEALEFLNCGTDDLAALTFGNNPNLREVVIQQTLLESLDLSTLSALEELNLSDNLITSLDLTGNPQLIELYAEDNQLSSIDITQCPQLKMLSVGGNQLTGIDLSQNSLLEEAYIDYNLFTEADFTANPNLIGVSVRGNQIEYLDLSMNPLLEYVYAEENNFFGFNIANGNNEELEYLDLWDNPNLSCVTVDDVTYAETNFTDIDVTTSFSTDCPSFRKEILTFTLSEALEDAVIDDLNHTVSVVVEAGTDISDLSPAITISEAATISPNSGIAQDFTTTVTYTVTAEDATTQDWDVTVIENQVAPTNIELSNHTIVENETGLVGLLSATDENFNPTLSFDLAPGEGDDDNAAFDVNDNELNIYSPFNYEIKDTYSIRIQVYDEFETYEEAFTISVVDANDAPTDIGLSSTSIDESNPTGTVVGMLSSSDEDESQNHSYSLVSGSGDTDNASFDIVGDELRSAEIFDFETKTSYSIRIQTDDENGGTFEKEFSITINDLPASVSEITLDNEIIDENQLAGIKVGHLSTYGESLSGSYTYTLVAGAGDTDNAAFSLSANVLIAEESFNYEVKNEYYIRVKTDDGTGNTLDKAMTILVDDVNESPTEIVLNNSSIAELNAVDDLIGSFSTIDEDLADSHIYSLVAGSGDDDNSSFTILGNDLIANVIFDYESQSDYSIRVESNDGNGGSFEKQFAISIIDVNESILVTNPVEDQEVDEYFGSIQIDLADVFTDQDDDPLSFSAESDNPDVATVNIDGSLLTIAEAGLGTTTITVTADDNISGETTDEFLLTVNNVNDAPVADADIEDQTLDEGFGSKVIDFSGVFSDKDADPLHYEALSDDETVVTVSIDGTILTLSEAGNGSTEITITADDGQGGTTMVTFPVIINNVNDAPVVSNEIADLTLDEGFETKEIDLTNTFADDDQDPLTIEAISENTAIITVTIAGNILSLSEGGNGSTNITVTASDGNGAHVSETFAITVNNVNDHPVAIKQIEDQTFDQGFTSTEIDLTGTFSDEDGDNLSFTVLSDDEGVVTGSVSANTLKLEEAGAGTTLVTITAEDGNGGSSSLSFKVTINETVLGLASNSMKVNLYPVPAQTTLTIESNFGTADNIRLMIYDLAGLKYHQQEFRPRNKIEIDVSQLKAGNYLLILDSGNSRSAQRFIKH
ncbi:MAG: Ig-like domain-containing protein [Cyclobacteriaceae bacterium]